jgi:GNAT superfamily N-acetyltransferase
VTVLPDGLTTRPLTLDDAAAVAELIAAEEAHDVGEADTTLEDIVSEWGRPSYDVTASTIGVFEAERLIAYADLVRPDFAFTGVLPAHRGLGIGTALADWLETLARNRGGELLSTQVPAARAADRLLAARGYRVRWTAWDLELPEGAEVSAQPLRAGYSIRDAETHEHELVYEVIEDAFSEWRDRGSLEDFAALVWGRPGHQPWNLRLCVDPDGVAVGATHLHLAGAGVETAGYVARIAVRRDRRGLGLAGAMLADAFTLARAHGAVRCYLSTDSRTGALGLYEKVGMQVSSTWVNRALDL